jgi:hypothetical protein
VCDGSIFQLIRSLGLLPVLHQGTIVAQVCAALHASVGVYHVINPFSIGNVMSHFHTSVI